MEKPYKGNRGKRKMCDFGDEMSERSDDPEEPTALLEPPKPLVQPPSPPIFIYGEKEPSDETEPCPALLQPALTLQRPRSPQPSSSIIRSLSPQPSSSISCTPSSAEEYYLTSTSEVMDNVEVAPQATPELEPVQLPSSDYDPSQHFEDNMPFSSPDLDWLCYSTNRCTLEDFGEREEEVESVIEEEDINDWSGNSPVYSGALITLHESLVSILTLALTYSLSGQCIQALLKVINLHCLQAGNVFIKSLFLFKKYFSLIQGEMDYEYYCSKCYCKCEKKVGCLKCEKGPLCCLIKLSLLKQLEMMFKRSSFFSKLVPLERRYNSSGLCELYDGALYKEYIAQGIIGELPSLSFMWYTDGASLYKSSKTSVWPLFLSINELPHSERFRKENLLVSALWCGPVKPHGNLLIDAAYPDLVKLLAGVDIEIAGQGPKIVKGVVLNGTGDTPARALMLNMVMFNGEHSCQKCEQKGETRQGYPGVRVFPYCPEEMKPRDKTTMSRYGELALMLRGGYSDAYMGVKGPTSLSKVSLDSIRGTAIDAMHLIYGGLGKLHIKFFLNSKYSLLNCNVSKQHKSVVDERLLSIKPPHYLTRVPKGTADVAIWNTSQYKSFFLYYSLPVLKGIVPEMNLKHYASLVAAIQLLNSDCVTPDCMAKAQKLISRYLSYFQDLYDKAYMTLNVHLLSHLVELVQEQGPLWVTACFPLESINGIVLNLVHGTRYPEMQIATSLQMCLGLQDMVDNLEDSDSKLYCEDLLTRTHSVQSTIIGSDAIIGRWEKPKEIPEYLKQPLTLVGLNETNITTFHCLRRDKIFYGAESYQRSSSRDSSSVVYRYESCQQLGLLKTFLRSTTCTCSTECSCKCTLYAVLQELQIEDHFSTLLPDVLVPNIHAYKTLNSYLIVPTNCLQSVCVKMVINEKLYIAQRCNQHETE